MGPSRLLDLPWGRDCHPSDRGGPCLSPGYLLYNVHGSAPGYGEGIAVSVPPGYWSHSLGRELVWSLAVLDRNLLGIVIPRRRHRATIGGSELHLAWGKSASNSFVS